MSALKGLLLKFGQLKPMIRIDPCNFRTLKSTLRVKWVRPVKLPKVDSSNTGDGAPIIKYRPETLMKAFAASEELKTADENVKKLFSLEMNNKINRLQTYLHETADKVRRHQYDLSTHEVYIAHLTAQIHFWQEYVAANPQHKKNKQKLYLLVDRRKKQLRHLRRWDYPRFEWLLEKLNIVYKPDPALFEQVARKKSLRQMTTIYCEEMKEKKIAEFRKKMDASKVPFLERKLIKLQHIKKQEEDFQLPKTVTDADIAECEALLAKTRLDVPLLEKKNYIRTIHPYTLEKYDAEELNTAEGREQKKIAPATWLYKH